MQKVESFGKVGLAPLNNSNNLYEPQSGSSRTYYDGLIYP